MRHRNSHRKCSTEEDDTRSFKPMKTVESNQCTSHQPSYCSQCGQKNKLIQNKKYCDECSKMGRECKHCHRPIPEKYYNWDEFLCDACYNKKEKMWWK